MRVGGVSLSLQAEPVISGPVVGASLPRTEDERLLTGRALFVDDLRREGMLYGYVLRSPLAHARLASIDLSEARAAAGVHAVLTAADLPEASRTIPMRLHAEPGMERFLQGPLATGSVRYVGEPVAFLVAESRHQAEDAAELVVVDYEPLEPVPNLERAPADGAPVLHPDAGTNITATSVVEWGDVDGAFAAANVVVEARLECGRQAASPLETRGLLAEIDGTGRLTVYGAAKVPHINRRILARLLDLSEEEVRLVEVDVGGGFGARGEFYPEDLLVPLCALRLGRPVSWVEDRGEHLRATNHSRRQIHEIALALGEDGRFLALRDRVLVDAGAYVRTQGFLLPASTAALLPGPYRWPAYRCEAMLVATTTTPTGAYRAPGRYEANFARERIIDIAAHRLGADPIGLRRQNLVRPEAMPYATGAHMGGKPVVYDSGDYGLLLTQALERFGYEEMTRWRAETADPARRRGVGIALYVEKSGVADWEYARVAIGADGATRVYTGASSLGQGLETALAQICADALGVPYERVGVVHVDTGLVPDGMGTYGSRSTSIGGSAVFVAGTRLRERLLSLASEALEVAAEDLEVVGDRVVARGAPSRAISFAELRELAALAAAPTGGFRGAELCEEHVFRSAPSYPYGVQCAAVEVDVETGATAIERYVVAYDIGRAINPALIEAQIVGGAAQGIGGALYEELAYDDESAQPLNGSFIDYLLPTAVEVPPIAVLVTENAPTPNNPLGAKGAGEGGIAGAGAAIANAVSDALGVQATKLPLTPDYVIELVARTLKAGPAGLDPEKGSDYDV